MVRRVQQALLAGAHGGVERPRRALALAAVLLVAAALAATQLTPSPPQSLLARSGSDVGAATIAQERAFGSEPIVVVLKGDLLGTTLSPATIERLLVLEQRLARIRGVRTVIGPATFVDQSVQQMYKVVETELGPAAERADVIARDAMRQADRDRRFSAEEVRQVGEQARLKALGPLAKQYQELFVRFGSVGLPSLTNDTFVAQLVLGASANPKRRFAWLFPDRDHALVILRTSAGLPDDAVRRVGAEASALVRSARLGEVEASVAGAPLVVAEASASIADELLRLLPVVLVAMALALLIGLRIRNRALHLLIPAGAAVLLTAGLSWLLGLGFTPATLAALPVVFGLALDYAVQLQARYWTARAGGEPARSAAHEALRTLWPTLLLAGGLMSIGFLALLLSPVPLVGRLGLTLAVGVGAALACLALLGVPLLARFDRRGAAAPQLALPAWRLPWSARSALLGLAVGVTVAGLVVSGGAEVESDLRKLADPDMASLQRLEAVQKELGTSGQIRVAVTGDNVTSREALSWMADAERRVLELDDGLRPGPNLATILGTAGQGVPDAKAIPRLLELIPSRFVSGILTEDRKRAELSFGIPLRSAEQQAELIARVQRVMDGAPAGVTAQVAGLQALSAAGVEGLKDGRPWLLLLAAAVMFAVLLAVRRDVGRAAIPLAPALLAAGAAAVAIELLGLSLSPLSAALDPLVLAVGVEFGVLLEARYREERAAGFAPDAAASRSARMLGGPVVVSAATVALGFAVLLASRLPVLAQFGAVAALELALCVVGAVLLVPSLAAAWDRRPARLAAARARSWHEAEPRRRAARGPRRSLGGGGRLGQRDRLDRRSGRRQHRLERDRDGRGRPRRPA